MKRTKRYGGFLVGDIVRAKGSIWLGDGYVIGFKDDYCVVEFENNDGHKSLFSPKYLINLTRQEEEKQRQQIEEYVYDLDKTNDYYAKEFEELNQQMRDLLQALRQALRNGDYETVNKIYEAKNMPYRIYPKEEKRVNNQSTLDDMNFLFKKSNQPIEKLPDNIKEPKEPEIIEFEKPLSEEAKRLKEIAENMQDRINRDKSNEEAVKAKQKAEYEQLAEDLAFLKDFGYDIRVLADKMLVGGLNIERTREGVYGVTEYSYKSWPYNSDELPTKKVVICASKELLVKFLVAYKSYNWEKAVKLYQTL